MPPISNAEIKKQFERAKANGWLDFFNEAADEFDFAPETLLAIASRETNMRNILGDGGHGCGLMQIDDRSFPDFCKSGQWKDPRKAILKGAEVLDQKYTAIEKGMGKSLKFRGKPFTGKMLDEDQLLQTAIASYNSGGAAYFHMSVSGDPDRGTTGKDYSEDVLKRERAFADLLGV